jgi:molybdopterin converting factor subunit 1
MQVTIRLFARLRDLAGAGTFTYELPEGATVRSAWQALVAAHPALAPFEAAVSSAINLEYAKMTAAVHEGDEVAFLPPVSGGEAAPRGEMA